MSNQHDWSCAILANRVGEEQFHLAALWCQDCSVWWEVQAEQWGQQEPCCGVRPGVPCKQGVLSALSAPLCHTALQGKAWPCPAPELSLGTGPEQGKALQNGEGECEMWALGDVTHLLCRTTGRWVAGLLTGCQQKVLCLVYWQPALLTTTHLLLLFSAWRISSSAVWQNIEYRRNNNFHLWRNTFGWD